MGIVTVNGVPLAEYVGEQQSSEIRKVGAQEIREKSWKRPTTSRMRQRTNGITKPAVDIRDVEREPDFTQWVLLRGEQYLRAAKEPFAMSGKSLLGAMQYDPDSDKVKCHECGEWHVLLGQHVRIKHDGVESYRTKHGLGTRAALVGMRHREQLRVRAIASSAGKENIERLRQLNATRKGVVRGDKRKIRSVEGLNKTNNCELQIPFRIKKLTEELGRVPTYREIKASGISVKAAIFIFGSLASAVRASGAEPRKQGDKETISRDELIAELCASRKLRGKWPTQRELNACEWMHSYGPYQREFGGLTAAIEIAKQRNMSLAS